MNKIDTISSQVINTMEQSNEPWGIKDKNSCFIYGNLALKSIKNFSSSFEFEGLYDHELPWAGAEFAKECVDHDRKVMEKEERVCSLETHTFGKEQTLSSYFCANKYTSKQISRMLSIFYHTVETHISRIYKRIGVYSSYQLVEYCRTNDYDLYMPKIFVYPKNRILLTFRLKGVLTSMNKSYSVSTQIINTMEQSNEPWGIKDKNSCFIYGNLALKSIKDFSSSFEFEGLYDHELPWAGAEFAKERVAHDRKVMEKEERICSLETHVFGKDKFLSSYFCEKTPIYHEDGSCMGTIFHGWQAKEYSLTYLYQYYDKLPPSILLQPPSDLFTQREWDIIFFFLQKQSRKQIGEILNITHREIEEHMVRIYRKIGIHSDQQLAEYCHANNFHHYIPERFLLS